MSRGRRSSSPSSLHRKQSTATTPLLASSSSSSSFSSMNRTSSVSSLSTVFHSAEEDGRREEEGVGMEEVEEDMWSNLLPELLGVIIKMVEGSDEAWPRRRNLVACAGVCKRWREVVIGTVESVGGSGKITFPLSLKQPGPKELPVQCFVKRNRKTSTFYLYLDLKEASKDVGKFLMAARRYNYSTHIEYIISLDADDLSERSNAYVGKLRSSFLGTKFKIYDTRPPFSGAKVSSSRTSRRFGSKQISPKVPSGNFTIGHVAYQFNVKCRGPRKISCTLRNSPYYETSEKEFPERSNKQLLSSSEREFIRLKNNTPRWHHQLKCWCLNFYGRVTVASVKNFQLSIAEDPCQYRPLEDPESVVLQFGKTSDNIFTMDYRHPLSAFQAFAICLTSFGNKLACE